MTLIPAVPTRIFLTGFMGSGKSTVAPLLASRLGHRWVDLDARVEAIAGVPITELFASRGEDAFRAIEREALAACAAAERVVVATGGGALASAEAMDVARRSGCVVYLQASPEALARRLAPVAAARPLLHGPGGETLRGEALRERVEALLRAREDAYLRADVVVDADAAPELVAARIEQALAVGSA